jgi:hypothetical protein
MAGLKHVDSSKVYAELLSLRRELDPSPKNDFGNGPLFTSVERAAKRLRRLLPRDLDLDLADGISHLARDEKNWVREDDGSPAVCCPLLLQGTYSDGHGHYPDASTFCYSFQGRADYHEFILGRLLEVIEAFEPVSPETEQHQLVTPPVDPAADGKGNRGGKPPKQGKPSKKTQKIIRLMKKGLSNDEITNQLEVSVYKSPTNLRTIRHRYLPRPSRKKRDTA